MTLADFERVMEAIGWRLGRVLRVLPAFDKERPERGLAIEVEWNIPEESGTTVLGLGSQPNFKRDCGLPKPGMWVVLEGKNLSWMDDDGLVAVMENLSDQLPE